MRYWLDIEASGLYEGSYPIEIAWVAEDGSSESYLIKPLLTWDTWSEESERIHNIPRSKLLSEGIDAWTVANRVEEVLSGQVVMTNAPRYDEMWLFKMMRDLDVMHTIRITHTNDALEDALGPLRGLIKTVNEPEVSYDMIQAIAVKIIHKAEIKARRKGFTKHRALDDAQELHFIWNTVRELTEIHMAKNKNRS